MSQTVTLSGKLPGNEETNGLDDMAADLVAYADKIRMAVVWFDASKVTRKTDTGEEIPTVRIRRVEPIFADGHLEDLRTAAEKAFSDRTGRTMLPLGEAEQVKDHE